MREVRGVFIRTVALVFLSSVLSLGWWQSQSHHSQPSSGFGLSLFDGDSQNVNPKTAEAVTAEMQFIKSEGFDLPLLSVSIVRPLGWNGLTTISPDPTRYSILIVDWAVFDENRIRKVVAHELGHVLLAERGKAQSEELADGFAICFGSPAARAGAQELGLTANCDEVRKAYL